MNTNYFSNSSPLARRNYSTPPKFKADKSRFLSDLSEPLYDHVRPRIIHETQIVSLSELCLLFQTQFMRDPDEGTPLIFHSNNQLKAYFSKRHN
jgi:hypothetical protein